MSPTCPPSASAMTVTAQGRAVDPPDYTAILDNLYIGNLSTALTLPNHPELGITHVLSVCPDYPEDAKRGEARSASVKNPRHHCIPVEDSEYEDILTHLPSAVAFIRDALDSSQARENGINLARKGSIHLNTNRVLVHCVMGISRSATIICAYLMATRGWSPSVALMFIRKRRPQAHPNFGFRQQLAVYAESRYFLDYKGPVKTHPAYAAWLRRRKREASRYLSRVDNIIEIKVGDENVALSMTEDFPTDSTEAASLLSEIEATHFLTIAPSSMPPLPPSHPPVMQSPTTKLYRRPPVTPCPPLARRSSTTSSSSSSEPASAISSAPSSRSSSFSQSSASTAATSVTSLQSLMVPSKLGLEVIYDSDDDADEPTFLELANAKHYHIPVQGPSPVDLFLRLNEAAMFIRRALDGNDDSDSDGYSSPESDSDDLGNVCGGNTLQRKRHVLINCKTESRACLVVCAYLMSARRMSPSQAYGLLERALPLFNVTRTFVSQLELFRACDYNPTPEHPLVRSWVSSGSPAALLGAAAVASGNPCNGVPRMKKATQWKCDSDSEGEDERDLRRKIGTPARCGSFSTPSSTSLSKSSATRMPQIDGPGFVPGTVDYHLDALLNRCAGVGNPDFRFDVEAFRSALHGISGGDETVADPGAGRKRKGGAG